ncbi:MAG: tRNA lysidine(34) synthetase TilS [Bdellovibrionales bacterium]|nr:tRNA lysidine(34) synthetase TilS [Bdellovibrionales bacterium]
MQNGTRVIPYGNTVQIARIMPKISCPVLKSLFQNLPTDSRLLVAISGGVDSVSLLHAVCQLKETLKIEVETAHVDHGLRAESGEDAEFVAGFAADLGLQFHLKKLGSCPNSQNVEAWARRQRYSFFKGILSKSGLDFVITAHHANDVAETLLMRLLSNKQPYSIQAIEERLKVIRPLLSISKAELERYASFHRLNYRVDQTNTDNRRLRNRVRNQLLPFLECQFDGDITRILAERAEALEQDLRLLNELTQPFVEELAKFEAGSREWLIRLRDILQEQPDPLRWRLVEELVYAKLRFRIGQEGARRALEVISGERVGAQLAGGLELRKKNGGLLITVIERE